MVMTSHFSGVRSDDEMVFAIRESDEIREIKSIEGNTYYLSKSAFGFGEEYIFFDKEGHEIERFSPNYSYDDIDGFYDLEDRVLFEGKVIRAEFSFSEFNPES
jgi:hypothetical protein